MTAQPLLTPYHSDKLDLRNRVVMAPLTRCRANNAAHAPNDLIMEYYLQRGTAGLLITEGTYISNEAVGYANVPGIYTPEQVAAWQKVTSALHAQGSKIFVQLWHVGRLSHPDLLRGKQPLAPSAVNPNVTIHTAGGKKASPTPHAMSLGQIQKVIADFVQAAKNALEAGFDGMEVHSSNGYLLHQFFSATTNHRTDQYGGSIENRARLLFEVLDALQAAGIDIRRVGARLNPSFANQFGMSLDAESIPTFDYIVRRLNDYDLAYLHLSEPFTDISEEPFAEPHIAQRYRPLYHGTLMINGRFDQEKGNQVLAAGLADLVSYGTHYIANPDLVERFAQNAPLAESNKETYYVGGPKGYTDYPTLAAAK